MSDRHRDRERERRREVEGGRARGSAANQRDRSPLHSRRDEKPRKARHSSAEAEVSWEQEQQLYDSGRIKEEPCLNDVNIKQEPDDRSSTHQHQRHADNDNIRGRDRDRHRDMDRNRERNTEDDRWRNRHRSRDVNTHKDRHAGRDTEADRQRYNNDRQRDEQRDRESLREQRRERYDNDRRRLEARANIIKQEPAEGENHPWGQSGADSNPSGGGQPKKEKEKPSLELSGKLADDTNVFRGVVIKYQEPEEARKPRKRWRFHPFKGDEALPILHLHRQSAYLLGRERKIADIPVDHPSCSKQHAVLQFRLVPYKRADGTAGRRVSPYIIDLGSANGTYVNNQRIEAQRYVELLEKDVVKFGFSSRDYVLLHDSSDTSEILGDDEGEA